MAPTRTSKSSRSPPVNQQVVWGFSKLSSDKSLSSTFTFDQLKATVRLMASLWNIRHGPRFNASVDNALIVYNDLGWIQADFETQIFTITDRGNTKFESIQDAIQNKDDPKEIFSAIKRHIGAPKGLTKPQLLSLYQQKTREWEANNARIRQLELMLAAGQREPPVAPQTPPTPLRKAMSLPYPIPYPTPISHPSRPRINFENTFVSPPSSPTPNRVPSMHIQLESSPAPPSRSVTPIAEEMTMPTRDEFDNLQTKNAELEAEIARRKQSQAELEQSRAQLVARMREETCALQELQVETTGLREQIELVKKERDEAQAKCDWADQYARGFKQVFNWK